MRARITTKPKAAPKPRKLNEAQTLLVEQLKPAALARGMTITPELVFHPTRKWRIDVALIEPPGCRWTGYAIEINGGVFNGGRHVRGAGFVKDMEKLNAMTVLGWRILQFTPQQVRDGSAIALIRSCL